MNQNFRVNKTQPLHFAILNCSMHNQYDYRCFRIIITKPQPKFEVQINVNLVDNTLKLN